ncbi:MAG: helicase-exonuclease AddAB subunit AddA, partial [Lachnospiraceae bacterium]|nr:helicase-exonuclease AddAB subunit AddA [Lachnospiraceae bacterium]
EKPDKGEDLDGRETEALVIAQQIQKLRREGKVCDAHTGVMRPVEFSDIVILLRTLTGWGDTFKAALECQGIPAYVTSKSGYFTATEVQDVLNYLRIIDNPLQDIPLFGVMRSFFGGFAEEEIARLRGEKKRPLYESLLESEDPRVLSFLQRLNSFREKTTYLTIRALMEKLIWEYDYLNYVTALPGGSKRRANLEMLLVKASDFEKTSYFGLFHFLRYMDMLEKYEEDYGEADTLDENANVVRIMSIHKSKGLEFPVVFVAGVTKGFNMTDVNKSVITEADLGIGMDFIDPVKRLKARTLRKSIIAKKLREDTLAEELRLLYVAMTRAKEKLVLTAVTPEPEKLLEESEGTDHPDARLSYLEFMKAKNLFDFLKPILRKTGMDIRVITMEDVKTDLLRGVLASEGSRENLAHASDFADQTALQKLRESFDFVYPYANLENLYVKTTVSELKIAAMSEKDEAAFHAFEEHETESYVPEFKRETEEVSGTVRGNAYHRVMELLDYEKVLGEQFAEVPETYEEYVAKLDEAKLANAISAFLDDKVRDARLSEEYRNAVRVDRICLFVRYEIGYRAWRADRLGKLRREQPFV